MSAQLIFRNSVYTIVQNQINASNSLRNYVSALQKTIQQVKLSDSQIMLCMSFSWSSGLDNRANFRKSSRSFLNFEMVIFYTALKNIKLVLLKRIQHKILGKFSQFHSSTITKCTLGNDLLIA